MIYGKKSILDYACKKIHLTNARHFSFILSKCKFYYRIRIKCKCSAVPHFKVPYLLYACTIVDKNHSDRFVTSIFNAFLFHNTFFVCFLLLLDICYQHFDRPNLYVQWFRNGPAIRLILPFGCMKCNFVYALLRSEWSGSHWNCYLWQYDRVERHVIPYASSHFKQQSIFLVFLLNELSK